jgi:predicted RecB family endonuclease
MIENVNQFLGTVAETELAKAARRSARTIWNAHRAAFETTRVEAGKVIGLAIDEGQKFAVRVKAGKAPAARKPVVRTTTRRSTRRAA